MSNKQVHCLTWTKHPWLAEKTSTSASGLVFLSNSFKKTKLQKYEFSIATIDSPFEKVQEDSNKETRIQYEKLTLLFCWPT